MARGFWGLCFAGLGSVEEGVSGSDTALKSTVNCDSAFCLLTC